MLRIQRLQPLLQRLAQFRRLHEGRVAPHWVRAGVFLSLSENRLALESRFWLAFAAEAALLLIVFIEAAHTPSACDHTVENAFKSDLEHLLRSYFNPVNEDFWQLLERCLVLAGVVKLELDFVVFEEDAQVVALSRVLVPEVGVHLHFGVVICALIARLHPLVLVERKINSPFERAEVRADRSSEQLPQQAGVLQVLARLQVADEVTADLDALVEHFAGLLKDEESLRQADLRGERPSLDQA